MTYSEDDMKRMMGQFYVLKRKDLELSKTMLLEDHFMLDHVTVYDPYGIVHEEYKRLLVPKDYPYMCDIEKGNDISLKGSIVEANEWLTLDDMFLPSAPLLANVFTRMFEDAVEKMERPVELKDTEKYAWISGMMSLDSYLMTNTIMDHENRVIKNYPEAKDLCDHTDEFITAGFNSNNPTHEMGFISTCSVNIDALHTNHSEADRRLLEAVLGYTNVESIQNMFKCYDKSCFVSTNSEKKGINTMALGQSLFMDFNMEEKRPFIYCIDASGGEYDDLL